MIHLSSGSWRLEGVMKFDVCLSWQLLDPVRQDSETHFSSRLPRVTEESERIGRLNVTGGAIPSASLWHGGELYVFESLVPGDCTAFANTSTAISITALHPSPSRHIRRGVELARPTQLQHEMARQCDPMKAFFILTYTSLIISFVVFVLSMLDLGFASWWMNLVLPLLTTAYHITILIFHRRNKSHNLQPRYEQYPTATVLSIVCIYVLGALWFVPFGIILGRGMLRTKGVYAGTAGTVGAQYGLDSAEFGVLCAIAGISVGVRRGVYKLKNKGLEKS